MNCKRTVCFYLFLSFIFFACNPLHSNLYDLGQSGDYNDKTIPSDFEINYFGNNDNLLSVSSEDPKVKNEHENQISFFVENEFFSVGGARVLRWNGCEKNQLIMGGYVRNGNRGCGKAFLQQDFYNHLSRFFFQCIQYSAKSAGYPKPVKVFIHHLGTYSNHQRRSLHFQARAMDITHFELSTDSGHSYTISTSKRDYQGGKAVFYDSFRNCWRASLPEQCAQGRDEYLGSVGHKASKLGGYSLNNDNLHVSLPHCATETGNFVTRADTGSQRRTQSKTATPVFKTPSPQNTLESYVFNCGNTIYRKNNYQRHSCLRSMTLKQKAELVMNDISKINQLRPELRLDPRFSLCVAYHESGISPNARGASHDYGIYQITNSTARYVLNMHRPVTPFFDQYRRRQISYRRAMLRSTLAQADLHHSVMLAKAKQEYLLERINRYPEDTRLLQRLATSYNGDGPRARRYGRKVAQCYRAMKQVASINGDIQNPSGVVRALNVRL